MFDLNSLKGKVLIAVSLSHIHEKVHQAWQDKSNEGFLICYEITLEFEDGKTYLIKPCEVDAIGYYPSSVSFVQRTIVFDRKHFFFTSTINSKKAKITKCKV